MADMDTYDQEPRTYDDERDYGVSRDRSRSRSPGPDRRDDLNGRDRSDNLPDRHSGNGDDHSTNPGSNLFVTGIHPRLTEDEVMRLFEKYGEVEKCNIMRDPHTRESRGFGFVKFVTSEQADAAKDGLQGEVYEGRTLSIEKARRARPRTPTPGKYFGPPKRAPYTHDRRGPPRDRYEERGYSSRRYEDRRGGGSGSGGYRDRYDDRGYGRRDDYSRVDRYASRDRYDDRRGYGGGGSGGAGGSYEGRPPRGPPAERAGYAAEPAGDAPPARRYDDRRAYD
ncbi:RNA-binding domain-containing protein [Polychaeton citri CBS 116435]|uniref:RNA-binding domain-containing protein n=1 Tax=Polychaeton citri CBS 116435 TaxID=1314669 RepID=A0A9P4Q6L4_9PEZI|nr:RNA-binding domain-containing protein [Polychaeton citri CBS 116435]